MARTPTKNQEKGAEKPKPKAKRKRRSMNPRGRPIYGVKPGPGNPREYYLKGIPEKLWEAVRQYSFETKRPARDIILTLLANMTEIKSIMCVTGARVEMNRVLKKDIAKKRRAFELKWAAETKRLGLEGKIRTERKEQM